MSVLTLTTTWCDEAGCTSYVEFNGPRTTASKDRRKLGWRSDGTDDYCPTHAALRGLTIDQRKRDEVL